MRELQSVVIRHLKTKRESDRAVDLWNKLWGAFERDGAEAVADLLHSLAEQPEVDEENEI
jgi:hypothetical protein